MTYPKDQLLLVGWRGVKRYICSGCLSAFIADNCETFEITEEEMKDEEGKKESEDLHKMPPGETGDGGQLSQG